MTFQPGTGCVVLRIAMANLVAAPRRNRVAVDSVLARSPGLKQPWASGRNRFAVKIIVHLFLRRWSCYLPLHFAGEWICF
jgi:hypothetical protein